MAYQMVITLWSVNPKMALCSVIGGIISTFWKECCSSVQRKFVFVQEWKRWIGLSASSMQKEQSGIPFFQICKAFCENIKYYVKIYIEICEDLY